MGFQGLGFRVWDLGIKLVPVQYYYAMGECHSFGGQGAGVILRRGDYRDLSCPLLSAMFPCSRARCFSGVPRIPGPCV